MIIPNSLQQAVLVAQKGIPAALTSELLKQISGLIYIKTTIGGYFFDAVFSTGHSTHLNITSHPVQLGANISDHAYMEPARITVDLGMSDAHLSLVSGQFSTAASRSKAAYEALVKLQSDRKPFTVVTRLSSYDNILLEDLSSTEDNKSYNGLRATATLRQIIMVSVPTLNKISARPQTTGKTPLGNIPAVTPKETTASKIEGWINGK